MRKEYFEDCAEIALEFYELIMSGEYSYVGIIADGETCGGILNELLTVDMMDDPVLSFEEVELNGTSEYPYYLTIDEDFGVWVQPALCGDKKQMLHLDDDLLYVQSGFLKKVKDASLNDETEFVEFYIGETEPSFNLIKNDSGEYCGFVFDSQTENPCVRVSYCTCGGTSVTELVDKYNKFAEMYAELMK